MHDNGASQQDRSNGDGPDFESWDNAEFDIDDSATLRFNLKWTRRIFELIKDSNNILEVTVIIAIILIAVSAISFGYENVASTSVICITIFGCLCILLKIFKEANNGRKDSG